MKVNWTSYAIEDVRAIRSHISRDSEYFAGVVVERIFTRSVQLQSFPESGQIVPAHGRKDIREVLMHSYRIVYHVLPDHHCCPWFLYVACYTANGPVKTGPFPSQEVLQGLLARW